MSVWAVAADWGTLTGQPPRVWDSVVVFASCVGAQTLSSLAGRPFPGDPSLSSASRLLLPQPLPPSRQVSRAGWKPGQPPWVPRLRPQPHVRQLLSSVVQVYILDISEYSTSPQVYHSNCQWSESHSVMSDSLPPHGLYSPWNCPGQNTGVGSPSLLQGIFPTQGSNPGLLNSRPILYQLSHQQSPNCNCKRTWKIIMLSMVFELQATSVFNNCSLGYYSNQSTGRPGAEQGTCRPLSFSRLEMGGCGKVTSFV